MPNWVYNGLTIEGNPDSVNKLVEQMNQPFTVIHDSYDVNLGRMSKKKTIYSRPVFAFWNIIKPTDLEAYYGDRNLKQDISEAMKFEGNDWYDFNVREWGTKWDVAVPDEAKYNETEMEEADNGENKVVYYRFNTAWSRPMPALEKLSAQYPDLLFTLSYEEETGWGGELEILRGQIISESEYNTKCNECDAYDTLEYCEECEYDCCDTCGWNGDDVDTHKAHMVEFALTNKENA